MVQSIDRAMQIVQALISDETRFHWSISDLAEKTKLPISTVHRLISTLIQHGLVEQVADTKQYKAGHLWMEIGLRLLENVDYRVVARPIMEALAMEVKESTYLNIPHGTDAIIIERVDSPLKVRIIDNLGIRIPLHIGAGNKTILANFEEREMTATIEKLIPTEGKRLELYNQLRDIKQQGYAISYGERTEGTASIAAPIIGYGNKVVGALSIGVLSYQITDERLAYLIEKVKDAAQLISQKIGKTP